MALSLEDFAIADLDAVLHKLTSDEKIDLLAGFDWWTTVPVPRLGVPAVKCSDGPNGVRGQSHFLPTPATCIPCGTALGATFDTDLVRSIGSLLADECRVKNVSLLLGPTCNIPRNPLNGRTFESFSEDPFLSGLCAGNYVAGLQGGNVGSCIKHFVANDMETSRFAVNVVVPERALREVYLLPFMMAQRIAEPWAYMTSYSRVNGTHVSHNKRLLQEVLRDEWGFDGFIMSDWRGTYSTVQAIEAGLDLEMPGATRWRGIIARHSLNSGTLSIKDVNARVIKILEYVQRCVRKDIETVRNIRKPERIHDTEESRALNRDAARSAIVLLKNEAQILPIVRKVKSLAVIGPNAQSRSVSGGGSAYLRSSYISTPYQALKEMGEERGFPVVYSPGCYGDMFLPMLDGWMKTETGESGWTARFYNDDPATGGALVKSYVLPSSRLRINDEKPDGLNEFFYITLEAYITAPMTGPYNLGLSVCSGRAKLSVNGKMAVDNGIHNKQTAGTTFYGWGTIEEKGVVDFVAGQTYKLEVYYTCVPKSVDGADEDERAQPSLLRAALQVGCQAKLDEDRAIKTAVEVAEASDVVVVVIGTNMDIEEEAHDRPDLELPGRTNELLTQLLQVRPDAIIVNQTGSAVTFPWVSNSTTLLQSWFGGNETGRAITDVIFGLHNPCGRLPLSFPYRIEDCTAHLNWGAESNKVVYGEGLFVGYKGYEETKRDVMFAFGEGKSYTTFAWSNLDVQFPDPQTADDIRISVTLSVTNTGSFAGSDVVQIYVTDPVCSYRRPKKELKGVGKVYLAPHETKKVSIEMDKLALSFYDDTNMNWVAEKGDFILRVCKSSRDCDEVLRGTVALAETLTWTGT